MWYDQQIVIILERKLTIKYFSALSSSGRYIFCGSDDNNIHSWDTLKTTYTGKNDADTFNTISKNKIVIFVLIQLISLIPCYF